MSLELSIAVDERHVDLSMRVHTDEVVAVLGPNGAGKSTILEVVSGLLRPDRGCARLDDRTILNVGDSQTSQVWVPPHDRGVALLAQEPLLFPHLTALDNVAFGPRSTGKSRRGARSTATHWLTQVEALEHAQRKPAQLSGGQAQRVAVARALAAEPRLLLLDEPMAALDVAVAPSIRQMLRRVLRGQSTILVTHDVLDALLLADRVIVVDDGRVVEQGPTAEVLARPRSGFAARIAGLNLVSGTCESNAVRTGEGLIKGMSDQRLADGERAVAVFRPSAVGVYRDPPGGSIRNVIPVTISELEPIGNLIRVRSAHLSADITAASVAELDLVPGTRVLFAVKASEVAIYRA